VALLQPDSVVPEPKVPSLSFLILLAGPPVSWYDKPRRLKNFIVSADDGLEAKLTDLGI